MEVRVRPVRERIGRYAQTIDTGELIEMLRRCEPLPCYTIRKKLYYYNSPSPKGVNDFRIVKAVAEEWFRDEANLRRVYGYFGHEPPPGKNYRSRQALKFIHTALYGSGRLIHEKEVNSEWSFIPELQVFIPLHDWDETNGCFNGLALRLGEDVCVHAHERLRWPGTGEGYVICIYLEWEDGWDKSWIDSGNQ